MLGTRAEIYLPIQTVQGLFVTKYNIQLHSVILSIVGCVIGGVERTWALYDPWATSSPLAFPNWPALGQWEVSSQTKISVHHAWNTSAFFYFEGNCFLFLLLWLQVAMKKK